MNGAGTESVGNVLMDVVADMGWARRLARQLVCSDEADDLLQEAWLAVRRRPPPQGVAPRRWLAAVMRNLARFAARSRGRRTRRERVAGDSFDSSIDRGGPDDLVERMQAQRLLAELVLALPSAQREVVLLRFQEELAPGEIARRIGIPAGTVRSRLSLALAQLRAQLAARTDERTDVRRGLALLAAGGPPWVRPVLVVGSAAAMAASLLLAWGTVAGSGLPPGPPEENVGAASVASIPVVSREERPRAGTPESATPPGRRLATQRQEVNAALLKRAQLAPRYQVPLGAGPIRGPADAKVTIIEFADYECPFTARAESQVRSVLARYPADVRLQVIQRPLAFHANAALLARAAVAAARQEGFWAFHERLLGAELDRWSHARLEKLAREAGLDPVRFRRDLDGQDAGAQLEIDEATADSLNVQGTPTFFINGRLVAAVGESTPLQPIVEEELARAEALLLDGADRAGIYNAAIASGQPVILQTRVRSPLDPPPASGRSSGFESLFRDGGSCSSPLEEPDLSFSFASKNVAGSDKPIMITAWSLISAGGLEHYRTPASKTCPPKGPKGLGIASTTAGPDDFLAKQQAVFAARYHGQRVRFSGDVAAANVTTWAGIWIRAVDRSGKVITSARTPIHQPERGGQARPESVELVVPAEAQVLSYGIVLAGRGSVSIRNLQLDAGPP
jgi:RNA polymerase sigma factor (sigma-70 family)